MRGHLKKISLWDLYNYHILLINLKTKMSGSINWYMKEVFRWRTGASIAWSLLLLPPAAGVYICLAHFALLHPSQWLTGWLHTCFSLSGVANVGLILFCTAAVAVMNAFFYTVTPHIHKNRVSIILSVTRPTRLLHTLSHAFLGGLTAWGCCKLVGARYQALSARCSGGHDGYDGGLCLNEHHLFLVLLGTFLGAVYSINYFVNRANLLSFSIIHQVKFFQVKSQLGPSILTNAVLALRLSSYFYITYYLCGCVFKSWLLTNLRLAELPIPVDSLCGLLDVRLLWQALLLATLLIHLWTTSLYLFKVFNTEIFEFPIETAFNTSQECTLYRALGQGQVLGQGQGQTSPLVGHLAYQDLSILAEHSPARRKQLFSLSQPGGHPHNWTRVSNECLALIASFTDRLVAHRERAANGLSREKKLLEGEKKEKGGVKQKVSSSGSFFTATSSPAPHQRVSTLTSATIGTPVNPPRPSYGSPRSPMHNVSYSALTPGRDNVWVDSPASQSYVPSPRRPIKDVTGAHTAPQPAYFMQRPQYFFVLRPRLDWLRRLALYRYFMDPFPEADTRALFTDCQLHIWALEGLSSLIAASYQEDSYGVVQKSLPDILTEMLALHNALEKLLRLPNPLTTRDPRELKVTRIGPAHPDDQLRNDLRTTVKTSLHRVLATFRQHIKSVPLAPEYRKQLAEFMEYKL